MALKKPLVLNGGQLQRLQTNDTIDPTGLFDANTNLGGINGLATNGLTVHNGTAFTTVSLTAPAAGMTITNPSGTGGSPTFAFTDELAQLISVSTGMLVKTGTGTLAARTIIGTSGTIAVTNGTGVSGNPTITLADNAVLPGTGAVTVPVGGNAQLPASPTVGMIRYNSDTSMFEFRQGTAWVNYGTSNSVGTVTSVDVVLPDSLFSASSGAITTSGTISFTLDTQVANAVFAGPTTGGALAPTFRALVAADIPVLDWSKITTGKPTTLSGYGITDAVANTVQVIAGTGLTGGGALSSNVTLSLAAVGVAVTDQFVKVTTDAYGRVTATTAVGALDITTSLGYTPVNKDGDTMSGILNMGGFKINSVGAPVASTDAATKAYVDSVAQGLAVKPAVLVATTTNLTATYANGTLGVGATLTLPAAATLAIDGVGITALQTGVLVKDQTTAYQNGRYYVSQVGDSVTPWILTRCTSCDEASEIPSMFVFVQSGTQIATGWAALVADPMAFDVGIDAVTFTQFSNAGSYLAGTGLTLTGNTFSVGLGAGIAELPGDEVGIDLFDAAAGALALTTTGADRSTATGAKLALLLNGTTLAQSASGLNVAAGGITATELASSVAGNGLSLSTSDLSVNVDNTTLEINTDALRVKAAGITETHLAASVAGAGLLGGGGSALSVNVGTGALEIQTDVLNIKTAGVTNAMLANSTVLLAGTTGTGSVALGSTLTIAGSNGITTATSGSTTTVTLAAGLDNLSDVTLTTNATGDLLVRNASGQYVNVQPGATSGVQPYDTTLSALASLSGVTGMVVETGTNAFATRVIAGTVGRVTVTNGDGIAGDPTIDLASGVVTAGTYSRVTVDTYGRVTAGSTVEASTQVAMTNANAGDLVIGTPVYVSVGGSVDKADAGAGSTTKVIGLVADTAIATTVAGNVAVAGIITATTGQWDAVVTAGTGGLVGGSVYFLEPGTAGKLTTTAPSVAGEYIAPVGIALSSTKMKIQIDPTIQL